MRTVSIDCDYDDCEATITWDGDGVNDSPEGWVAFWLDDEQMFEDFCPVHQQRHTGPGHWDRNGSGDWHTHDERQACPS